MFVCSLPCEAMRCGGDKLEGAALYICWLVCVCLCVCFDGVMSVSRGDGGPPCLHCASDLWPFVTRSEWEGRAMPRVRGRGGV